MSGHYTQTQVDREHTGSTKMLKGLVIGLVCFGLGFAIAILSHGIATPLVFHAAKAYSIWYEGPALGTFFSGCTVCVIQKYHNSRAGRKRGEGLASSLIL